MTKRILALVGSLRAASSNLGLANMARRVVPEGFEVVLFEGLDALPYYNADHDHPNPVPAGVQALRDAINDADAVLIAAPEYNWNLPAVLKNAIDWASRPYGASALNKKVISVVSSGSKGGARKAQGYLVEILALLGNTVINEPEIAIAMGPEKISFDGTTTDPEIEALVTERMAILAAAL